MIELLALVLVRVGAAYLMLGVLFAVPFVLRGAGRIDASADEGSIGFRALILPGTVLLWPLLAVRWMRAGGSA